MVPNVLGLPALVQIALSAGGEIMEVYRSAFGSQQKADGSPLTEADLRADRVIRAGLAQHFPGVWIWSEESSHGDGAAAPAPGTVEHFFLVDPLDGTREFIARNGEFTVNIALVEQGIPVAGVVVAPALGEVFCAAQGHGAWGWRFDVGSGAAYPALSQAHALRVALQPPLAPLRVLGSRSHRGDDAPLQAWLAQRERGGRTCIVTPCGSSLKFCRIAQGAADAYPRFGPTSQWDTAAGQCVLEAAGGQVLDLQGRTLRYGLDRDVINPDFIASGQALG